MSPAEKPYINDTLRQNHQVGRQGFAAYANSCRLHKLEELQHEKKYKVVCLWYRHPHNRSSDTFCLGLPSAGSKRTADIQTGALADDTQTESPTVDDHTEADNGGVPTAAPEALAVGLRGVGETIHDTETMGEGSRDYTLNRVEVYDTIEDSPISLSECVPNTSYDTYQTWKFILLDMNVTNTSESEMEPRTGEEYQFMLDLIPRNEGDSQMLYFSAHPDSTNSASDYNKFNLAPGDTLNFQIGIFIEPSAWEEQSVYLQVGYDNASGVGFSYFS